MLDLRTLRLAIGDAHRDKVNVLLEPLTVGGVRYEPVPARLEADIGITRMTSGLLFDLALQPTLFGPCQRCLEEARVTPDVQAREYEANDPEPGTEADTTSEYLQGELLDVDRWARDATALALPLVVICREDCAGLCPTCGANLNETACGCEPAPDPRWTKLRDLLWARRRAPPAGGPRAAVRASPPEASAAPRQSPWRDP